ncbi:MAG: hypothetical protein AAF364_15395 [Pseudomonadota bacterium]
MRSTPFFSRFFFYTFLLFGLILSTQVSANVALSKFRVYFDGKTRTASLQLRNTGAKEFKYTAELTLNEMTEEGAIYSVNSDPLAADKFIRFSPKRGTIKPGERQALRFALRKPSGLADGEYRAVLRVVTELAPTEGGNVNLASKLAYNVPIIVRHGEVVAESNLASPTTVMHNGQPHIQVWQTRTGNRSLFGDYVVETTDGETLGVLNNVAVYRPLERRKVLIPLTNASKGDVVIRYTENEKFGGSLVLSIPHTIN